MNTSKLDIEEKEHDYLFKLCLIGDSCVGKSNILLRFTRNEFDTESKSTIGVEFAIKNILVEDKIVKLQCWDCAGQERFRTITSAYFRGAHGIFLVFDVSNIVTFQNLQRHIQDVNDNANHHIQICLVGNKCDLTNRIMDYQDGKKLAKEIGANYFETSALSGKNIENIFISITILIKQKIESKIGLITLSENNIFTKEDRKSILQPILSFVDEELNTTLMMATMVGNDKVVELLIENGSNLDQKNKYGNTALMLALIYDQISIAKIFIAQKASLEIRNEKGYNSIILASLYGNETIVKLLLANNIDINTKNHQGVTALMSASFQGYYNIVSILIDHNADINIQNNFGYSALMLSSIKGFIEIIKLLIDNGANVNAMDIDGNNSLMLALEFDQIKTAKILLERSQIEYDILNKDHKTAIDYANEKQNTEILDILCNKKIDDCKQLVLSPNPSEWSNKHVICWLMKENFVSIARIIARQRIFNGRLILGITRDLLKSWNIEEQCIYLFMENLKLLQNKTLSQSNSNLVNQIDYKLDQILNFIQKTNSLVEFQAVTSLTDYLVLGVGLWQAYSNSDKYDGLKTPKTHDKPIPMEKIRHSYHNHNQTTTRVFRISSNQYLYLNIVLAFNPKLFTFPLKDITLAEIILSDITCENIHFNTHISLYPSSSSSNSLHVEKVQHESCLDNNIINSYSCFFRVPPDSQIPSGSQLKFIFQLKIQWNLIQTVQTYTFPSIYAHINNSSLIQQMNDFFIDLNDFYKELPPWSKFLIERGFGFIFHFS